MSAEQLGFNAHGHRQHTSVSRKHFQWFFQQRDERNLCKLHFAKKDTVSVCVSSVTQVCTIVMLQ